MPYCLRIREKVLTGRYKPQTCELRYISYLLKGTIKIFVGFLHLNEVQVTIYVNFSKADCSKEVPT